MFDSTTILFITSGYLILLFGIAELGEKLIKVISPRLKSIVVALAMGTYCTAWTFYGTISQALHNGWYFPPTFIGSCITLLLGFALLVKMFERSKQYNITSIADFISAQYGKSDIIAGLVTLVSCIAVLPYIALQLKAVSMSLHIMTSGNWEGSMVHNAPFWQDTTFTVAILMALFAIVYGTREIKPTERHSGLLVAMGFESLIKLISFALVGLYVAYVLFDGVEDVVFKLARNSSLLDVLSSRSPPGSYFSSIVLGMAAIVCLPRHFHILVVESSSINDLRAIRWIIPLYLIIVALFVLIIAYGGLVYFHSLDVNPESYFIAIPLSVDNGFLTLFAFIGGLSAATSMVILATIAISTMISNNLMMPILLRLKRFSADQQYDLTRMVKGIRRVAIVVFVLLAYSYYRYLGQQTDLPTIGLLAMALVAQFAPSMLASLFAYRGHPGAVILGIVGGSLIWTYTLLLPALLPDSSLFMHSGQSGSAISGWLQPRNLFDLGFFSPLGNGVFWSLLTNTGLLFGVSFLYRNKQSGPSSTSSAQYPTLSVAELKNVAARFIGDKQADLALKEYTDKNGVQPEMDNSASAGLISFFEMMLAGIIGIPSARHVLAQAGSDILERGSPASEILEETSQVFQFSRELLQSSMDQISQGISIIDANHRLLAWNQRYLDIFTYPEGMIYVGRPVVDLIEYNASRGECGPGSPAEHIEKRLTHLARGTPYVYHRKRRDNIILEIRGNPLPGSGYVTTYTDVTEFVQALEQAQSTQEQLEERVMERTSALVQTNEALQLAKQEADKANLGKTKFLASAGHDLIQPLNAAKLFVSTLLQHELDDEGRSLVNHLSNSLQSAETLITELLEIAKIDAGIVKPRVCEFNLNDIITSLREEFTPVAEERQLALHCIASRNTILSDPVLLNRILANLLSNAIKYTNHGRITIGCRRKGNQLNIEVRDTGVGIAKENHDNVFEEFRRLSSNDGKGGLGLGLSTVQRLCKLLGHELELVSRENRGSIFRISVPLVDSSGQTPEAGVVQNLALPPATSLNLNILLVDDDQHIRESMQSLMQAWGARISSCSGPDELETLLSTGYQPELLIVDYHLNDDTNGVDLALSCLDRIGPAIPCIIISADHSKTLSAKIRAAGFLHIEKPIKPLKLRNVLLRYANRKNRSDALNI